MEREKQLHSTEMICDYFGDDGKIKPTAYFYLVIC